MRQLFCDLDGVLVDFEQGFLDHFGFACDSVPEREMWAHIGGRANHWRDLPLMPDAMDLWNHIKLYDPIILTGCPKTGYFEADAGKRYWCREHLGEDVKVITCLSRNKPKHMISEGDILVDDLVKNTKRWAEAGGIGITHTSARDTIMQLELI